MVFVAGVFAPRCAPHPANDKKRAGDVDELRAVRREVAANIFTALTVSL
jgi:hypothetical protein